MEAEVARLRGVPVEKKARRLSGFFAHQKKQQSVEAFFLMGRAVVAPRRRVCAV